MGVRFLLDTNVLGTLVREPQGIVTDQIRSVGEENVCTSVIVAAELRLGAAKKRSPKLTARVERILEAIDVLSLEPPVDRVYARIRRALEKSGTPIGGNDLLIGSHAIAAGCVLVTDNRREFARIEELSLENWLR